MDTVLSMSGVHPRDRVAYWYDVACKAFVAHECKVSTPQSFDATLQNARLGDLGIVTVESRGLNRVERTSRCIANGDDDYFLLCLEARSTSVLIQDGREAVVYPGDFALLDAQRHYLCRYQDRRQTTIKIPHRALKARVGPTMQLTARAVRHTSGLGGLLSHHIQQLPHRLRGMQPAEHDVIGEQLLDLIALALSAYSSSDKFPTLSSARAVALLQLRAAIEARLDDPALNPESAAAAAGISVRYANSLLAEEGQSLQRLIITRRLDRCRLALQDAMQAHRTISEIAFTWGFSDAAHFNRRFKAAFGCTPRDYRREHLVAAAARALPDARAEKRKLRQ